jgi:hypothetical protein
VPPSDPIRRLPADRFRPPLVGPEVPGRETDSVNFGDLVRMLGEGIADAQASLDRSSAELIADDGTVTFEHGAVQQISLLALGVTPTFYQFSSATVEAVMDLKSVEVVTETGEKRLGLFANTASVKAERKLNRDVTVTSRFTATLVPVPMPVRLDAVRTVTPPPPPPS